MEDASDEKPMIEDDSSLPMSSKKALGVSMVIIMFYMIGIISFDPLMGQYVRYRVSQTYSNGSNNTVDTDMCTRNNSNKDVQISIKVQKESALFLLYLSLPSNIIAIFVNFVIGSYSDFLGRKFLFFVPTLGAGLMVLVLLMVSAFNLSLHWLFLGAVLQGCSGGWTSFLLAVFSYTADVTKPNKTRTIVIAVMEGLFAVSGSVGSIAIGFFIQKLSFTAAAGLSVSVFVTDLILLIVFLPETLTCKAVKEWSPLVQMKQVLRFFFTGTGQHKALYILPMLVFYFSFVTVIGRVPIETLYQLDRPFCWSPEKIGYYGAIRNTFGIVSSVVALKLLQPYLQDMTIGLFGLGLGMVAFVLEGLAVNDAMLYIVPVVCIISYNIVPVCRSILSRMTSPYHQGALFSSLAAMETFCTLTSNVIYNSVYQSTVATFRGGVFILMAFVGIITTTLGIIFLRLTKNGIPVYKELPELQLQQHHTNAKHDDHVNHDNND